MIDMSETNTISVNIFQVC